MNFKRLFVSFFAFLLILLTTTPLLQAKADDLKLNKTRATLYVDKSFKLKVSNIRGNKVKWESSNPEVATVTKWGTVKGISKGKTVITATVGSSTLKCTVNVKYNKNEEVKKIKQEFIESKTDGKITEIHCLLTNESNLDLVIGFEAKFYDAADQLVSINNLYGYSASLPIGQGTLISFTPPDKEYLYYKVDYTNAWEIANTKVNTYLTINTTETLRKSEWNIPEEKLFIDLLVTNSSKKNIYFSGYIAFYKNDQLIKVQALNYNTLDINDNVINNRECITFEYDNYKVVYNAKLP